MAGVEPLEPPVTPVAVDDVGADPAADPGGALEDAHVLPDSSNARAHASPATPAPITATSVASMFGEYRRAGGGNSAQTRTVLVWTRDRQCPDGMPRPVGFAVRQKSTMCSNASRASGIGSSG